MHVNKVTIVCIIPSSLSKKILPFLAQCIAALQQPTKLEIRIILSTNSTHFFNNVKPLRYIDKLIVCKPTDGFSTLNNAAIDFATATYKPQYFLLINDDAFIKSDFFVHLEKIINRDHPDIIIPCIYDLKNKVIDSYGVEYFKSGYAKNSTTLQQHTTLATAGCVVIDAQLLKNVRQKYGIYFNPLLNFYLEDVELSIRLAMLGARFYKDFSLKVFHQVSASSGKKSRFTMYQTYRNILWVIVLTWPLQTVVRNILSILIVQGWVFLFSCYKFGPILYGQIVVDTVRNLGELLKIRKKYLGAYDHSKKFEDIFSNLTFRTYHGIKIKLS